MRSLKGKSVVITGASSGIGRAAALAFARQGANLTLTARRAGLLDDVARECKKLGGRAISVPADVANPAQVSSVAREALDRFGSIDVWVNNAGVGVFGPYQNASMDLHRKTIETNLLGEMHGAHAVLPIFLRQRHGILINNVSLGGWAPAPFAASYCASKFGLRGFTASLRQELRNYPDIHVCAVFPAIVDTPGLNHVANASGRKLNPGPFYYKPEDVAETFVSLALHPRDEAAVGWPSRAAQIGYGIMPFVVERVIGSVMRRSLRRAEPGPDTQGAILSPVTDGADASGGWLERKQMPPAGFLTKAGLTVFVGLAAIALAGQARAR